MRIISILVGLAALPNLAWSDSEAFDASRTAFACQGSQLNARTGCDFSDVTYHDLGGCGNADLISRDYTTPEACQSALQTIDIERAWRKFPAKVQFGFDEDGQMVPIFFNAGEAPPAKPPTLDPKVRSRLDQAKPFLCRESTKSDYPKGQLNVPGCTKGLYAGPVVCQDELGGEMEAYVECPADVVAKDGFTGCYKAALFRAAKGSRDKTEISLPETNSESAQ